MYFLLLSKHFIFFFIKKNYIYFIWWIVTLVRLWNGSDVCHFCFIAFIGTWSGTLHESALQISIVLYKSSFFIFIYPFLAPNENLSCSSMSGENSVQCIVVKLSFRVS